MQIIYMMYYKYQKFYAYWWWSDVLNDGVAKHDKLKVICNHHEQACAMGAVAYSKYTNKIGVAYVTTGWWWNKCNNWSLRCLAR